MDATLWLARERTIEARQRADQARAARAVRLAKGHRTLLQRIRGAG